MGPVELFERGRKTEPSRFLKEWHEEEPGVFETMRVYGRRVFRLEEHLSRLEASARAIGFALPRSGDLIRGEIETSVSRWLEAHGRPPASSVLSVRAAAVPGRVWVWVGARAARPRLHSDGAALRTSSFRRSPSHAAAPEAKTNAYQNAVLAYFDPPPQPDERLFLDADGFAAEASVGNIFLVKKGALQTPPARGILNGITRLFVLECARPMGIRTQEMPLTRHDFYNADEAFLTNTSWEILPVRELDGRRIGKEVPGPVTRKLHQTLKRRIESECRRSSSAAH